MYFNVNLNIHYTAPKDVWDRIAEVYREMPHWTDMWMAVPHGMVRMESGSMLLSNRVDFSFMRRGCPRKNGKSGCSC